MKYCGRHTTITNAAISSLQTDTMALLKMVEPIVLDDSDDRFTSISNYPLLANLYDAAEFVNRAPKPLEAFNEAYFVIFDRE